MGTVEAIPITDRDSWLRWRKADITASVAGALLGVHDYTTAFGVWMDKTDQLPALDETPAMKRGRLLEPVAVELVKEEHPDWEIVDPRTYYRDPETRLGATPDRFAIVRDVGRVLIQVKTTHELIYRQKWRDPDTYEVMVPLWIAIQALIETELSGCDSACVALMVVGMGLDLKLIDIPLNKTSRAVVARVKEETQKFWAMIERGEEPDPDYARDGRFISELYAEDDGGSIDLSADPRVQELIASRARHKMAVKEAEEKLKPIDAELKHRMGNNALAWLGNGEKMTWSTVRRAGYTTKDVTYRVLKTPLTIAGAAGAPSSFTHDGPF